MVFYLTIDTIWPHACQMMATFKRISMVINLNRWNSKTKSQLQGIVEADSSFLLVISQEHKLITILHNLTDTILHMFGFGLCTLLLSPRGGKAVCLFIFLIWQSAAFPRMAYCCQLCLSLLRYAFSGLSQLFWVWIFVVFLVVFFSVESDVLTYRAAMASLWYKR